MTCPELEGESDPDRATLAAGDPTQVALPIYRADVAAIVATARFTAPAVFEAERLKTILINRVALATATVAGLP
ncbi:hypothetical protein AB0M43_35375 [Longispora sp. NPDC051575]|uniref:hypothetical protein n=1 Tax=Longispora sp. NPDC051575 TaxID=3154943 RepID=UPI0034237FAC